MHLLLETCWIQTCTSGGMLCIFVNLTFVLFSWMCKKRTAVSHSSTEAGIISLDPGVRMEELPPLCEWECCVDVLAPSSAKGNLQSRHFISSKSSTKVPALLHPELSSLHQVKLAPMFAPGPKVERQEHLDAVVAFAGAGQRR